MDDQKDVREIIEEVIEKICDGYCKYTEQYGEDYDRMIDDQCCNCPLNRLQMATKCQRCFQIVQTVIAIRVYTTVLDVAHAMTIFGQRFVREKKKPESIGRVGANAKNQGNRITGAGEEY